MFVRPQSLAQKEQRSKRGRNRVYYFYFFSIFEIQTLQSFLANVCRTFFDYQRTFFVHPQTLMFSDTPSKNAKYHSLGDTDVSKRHQIANQIECTYQEVPQIKKTFIFNPTIEPYETVFRFDYSDEEWEYVQCFLFKNIHST